MVRDRGFDAGELAIVTFFQAREAGVPLVMLPAPIVGRFQHHCIALAILSDRVSGGPRLAQPRGGAARLCSWTRNRRKRPKCSYTTSVQGREYPEGGPIGQITAHPFLNFLQQRMQ
jgi:hypothetical protein